MPELQPVPGQSPIANAALSYYGVGAYPQIQRSQYLADAIKALQEGSASNIRTSGALGTNLLANAILQLSRQGNDNELMADVNQGRQGLLNGGPPLPGQADYDASQANPTPDASGSGAGAATGPAATDPATPGNPAQSAPPVAAAPAAAGDLTGPQLAAAVKGGAQQSQPPAAPGGLTGPQLAAAVPEATGQSPAPSAPLGGGGPQLAAAISGQGPQGGPRLAGADFYNNFFVPHEGRLNKSDANGTFSIYGLNKTANPDVTPNMTQAQVEPLFEQRYYDASGANKMPPALAAIHADTYALNPTWAKNILQQSGGDPAQYMALREQHMQADLAANPAVRPYAHAWANRNRDLMAYASQVSGQGSASAGDPNSIVGQTTGQITTAQVPAEVAARPYQVASNGSTPPPPGMGTPTMSVAGQPVPPPPAPPGSSQGIPVGGFAPSAPAASSAGGANAMPPGDPMGVGAPTLDQSGHIVPTPFPPAPNAPPQRAFAQANAPAPPQSNFPAPQQSGSGQGGQISPQPFPIQPSQFRELEQLQQQARQYPQFYMEKFLALRDQLRQQASTPEELVASRPNDAGQITFTGKQSGRLYGVQSPQGVIVTAGAKMVSDGRGGFAPVQSTQLQDVAGSGANNVEQRNPMTGEVTFKQNPAYGPVGAGQVMGPGGQLTNAPVQQRNTFTIPGASGVFVAGPDGTPVRVADQQFTPKDLGDRLTKLQGSPQYLAADNATNMYTAATQAAQRPGGISDVELRDFAARQFSGGVARQFNVGALDNAQGPWAGLKQFAPEIIAGQHLSPGARQAILQAMHDDAVQSQTAFGGLARSDEAFVNSQGMSLKPYLAPLNRTLAPVPSIGSIPTGMPGAGSVGVSALDPQLAQRLAAKGLRPIIVNGQRRWVPANGAR